MTRHLEPGLGRAEQHTTYSARKEIAKLLTIGGLYQSKPTLMLRAWYQCEVYSGCWEGNGQIRTSKQFHSVLGENLPWSSPDIDDFMDVFVSVDIGHGVGVAQAGPFAVPMICEHSTISEGE